MNDNYKETSREALEEFQPVSPTLDDLILGEIEASGSVGITCEGIELRLGRKHQAVSGNLRHLVERGLVKHSGEYGRTSSNRRAMLWIRDQAEAA